MKTAQGTSQAVQNALEDAALQIGEATSSSESTAILLTALEKVIKATCGRKQQQTIAQIKASLSTSCLQERTHFSIPESRKTEALSLLQQYYDQVINRTARKTPCPSGWGYKGVPCWSGVRG